MQNVKVIQKAYHLHHERCDDDYQDPQESYERIQKIIKQIEKNEGKDDDYDELFDR